MTRIPLRIAAAAAVVALLALSVPASAQMKVGVFDRALFQSRSKYAQSANERLTKMANNREAGVKSRQQEITDLENKYATQSLSMNDSAKEELLKQIQQKKTELKRFAEDSANEIEIEMAKLSRDLEAKFRPIVKAYGDEQGYSLIVDSEVCAYFSDAVNVTEAVVGKFDQTYGTVGTAAPGPRR